MDVVRLTDTLPSFRLPVEVNSKVYYQTQGKDVSLVFVEEEASKTSFARRGSGFALVTRKASVMKFHVSRVRSGPE